MKDGCVILCSHSKILHSKFNMTRKQIMVHVSLHTLNKISIHGYYCTQEQPLREPPEADTHDKNNG